MRCGSSSSRRHLAVRPLRVERHDPMAHESATRCAQFRRGRAQLVPAIAAATASIADEAQHRSQASTALILELDLFRGRPMSVPARHTEANHGRDRQLT